MVIQNETRRLGRISLRLKFLGRGERPDLEAVSAEQALDTFQESAVIVDHINLLAWPHRASAIPILREHDEPDIERSISQIWLLGRKPFSYCPGGQGNIRFI